MIRPLVVVQSSPTKQTAIDLATAARERGFDVQDISFDRSDLQPPLLEGHHPVFVFGSVALLECWVEQYPEIKPWVWYDEAALDPITWADHLGDCFLNIGGCPETVGSFLSSRRYVAGEWHVRPLLNNKRPPGKLYTRKTLAALELPAEIRLWASPPSPIDQEVRVWIVDGEPVTASQYRQSGQLVRLAEPSAVSTALDVARHLAAVWLPHPHCVMDIANTPAGNWKVVEFNPIHGAGWYAADPGVVLDAFMSAYK